MVRSEFLKLIVAIIFTIIVVIILIPPLTLFKILSSIVCINMIAVSLREEIEHEGKDDWMLKVRSQR